LLADTEPADRDRVRSTVRALVPLLPSARLDDVVAQVDAQVHGFGALDPLLADPTVSDVLVNGGGAVWVEREGTLELSDVSLTEGEALQVIERVLAPLGRHVDRRSPIVDARLPDGSRLHAIVRPLAVDGPTVSIRRFGARRIALDDLCAAPVARLLTSAVRTRANVLVSGGASAGKTTLLNALASQIAGTERVITVEDAAELRLPGTHIVRLEARPANADGIGEVRVRDLVRSALRMRPDRIVVGEIRGGEALDMLQAMNTGHDGSLSTCHANSPVDALRRVETLVLMGDVDLPLVAVREQIVAAIDLVVHMARAANGVRRVVEVGEIAPDADTTRALRLRHLASADQALATPKRAQRWTC
jgi:pilus assembly protein CpaF